MATALLLFELPMASGSGTVGFAIYNADGTEAAARTTSGISEVPTASGKYSANPTLPAGYAGGFFVADDSFGNYVRGQILNKVNIQYVNSILVDGVGTSVDPWGPA
jgi:hypothetical protein